MSYQGLNVVGDRREPHVGGNLIEGDPFTFSPLVWNYLLERFAVQSVLDLGSGLGYSADYFHQKGARVLAVDGYVVNCQHARFPTIHVDLTTQKVQTRVDLVHCQEVVEHIAENFLDNLLLFLNVDELS